MTVKPCMCHLRNMMSAANRETNTTALRIIIDLPSYNYLLCLCHKLHEKTNNEYWSLNRFTEQGYMHSVSKKLGESDHKTKDASKIFNALQNSRHPLKHTFDNVRTASGNNQQRPYVESIAERLSHDFWWNSRPWNVHPWWPPSCGKTRKKSAGARSGEQGGWSSTAIIFWAGNWRTLIIGTHWSHCVQGHLHGRLARWRTVSENPVT